MGWVAFSRPGHVSLAYKQKDVRVLHKEVWDAYSEESDTPSVWGWGSLAYFQEVTLQKMQPVHFFVQ